MDLVSAEDIKNLLDYFSKNSFRIKDNDREADIVQKRCEALFAKDYKYNLVSNAHGELASTYPTQLIVLEQDITGCHRDGFDSCNRSSNIYESLSDTTKLRDLILKARVARCRTRFPLPVIYVDGKYICRSATLSGGPEIYTRSGYDFLFAGAPSDDDDEKIKEIVQTSSDWQLFTKVRSQDIRLLKTFSIGYICDLMVENKKVKFGMNVTSSEKVDKENRYSDFTILSLPYPGCEFFRDYRDNEYSGEGLVFDWNQGFVDAQLGLPHDSISTQLDVDWANYKSWDLVKLTQNYLKLMLKYLVEGTSGVLIHCISGWDRTPLFISLLRLSLWADGKVHASLSPVEITYLTVAYDWFLFGHNLNDRLNKGEEILFFCFYILKHLTTEEFSLANLKSRRISGNSADSQVDGVLLEEDPLKSTPRGSNTSLSSTCSSVSSRSQEHAPLIFMTQPDSGDESALHTNGNVPATLSYRVWPVHERSHEAGPLDSGCNTPATLTNSSDGSNSCNGNDPEIISRHGPSTSPVAVPCNLRQRSESSSSTGCGSWQIISGTGSVRGSASTRSSLSSPTLELNQNSTNAKYNLVQETCENERLSPGSSIPHPHQRSTRREKLQLVRNAFYSAYSSVIGFKFKNGSEGTGLATLIDQFAEKVGIKSGKTTV